MITDILLTLAYTLLFLWFIRRMNFFASGGMDTRTASVVFVVKVLAGYALTLIYTYFYTDRAHADIFKFFDDSEPIYRALFVNPVHYLQLVFGVNADAAHLLPYIEDTRYWALQTDEYWAFTGSDNVNFFNAHRLITRFNAVVRLFSFGSFGVHTVVMCFISLAGLVALFKAFYLYMQEKKKWLILVVFFMPSVMFWSSGVLKEGFIFLALGFVLYAFFRMTRGAVTLKLLFLFIVSLALLFYVKYYLAIALLPAMGAYVLALKLKRFKPALVFAGFYVIAAIFVILLRLHPAIPDPFQMLAGKQRELNREGYGGSYCIRNDGTKEEFVFFSPETKLEKTITDSSRNIFQVQAGIVAYKYVDGRLTGESEVVADERNTHTYYWEIMSFPRAGSYIEIPELSGETGNFFKAIPAALMNAFLRPHPLEVSSPLMWPAVFENILIVFSLLYILIRSRFKFNNTSLVLFALFSVVVLFIIIGATTPVLGSIARYKAPFLPLLMLVALCGKGRGRGIGVKEI